MQNKKQPAPTIKCRSCGKEVRGKYASKHHVCSKADIVSYSREAGLAAQRANA